MSRTISASSRKPYGLALVCRIWRAPRATVYRHQAPPRTEPPRRPGPVGPRPDVALLAAIRAVLAGSPFTAKATARCGRSCSRFRPRSGWNSSGGETAGRGRANLETPGAAADARE
jgi:hypothetical protein